MLATSGRGYQSFLEPLLRRRPLGLLRLRLVLVLGLFLGLGPIPLWPLAIT